MATIEKNYGGRMETHLPQPEEGVHYFSDDITRRDFFYRAGKAALSTVCLKALDTPLGRKLENLAKFLAEQGVAEAGQDGQVSVYFKDLKKNIPQPNTIFRDLYIELPKEVKSDLMMELLGKGVDAKEDPGNGNITVCYNADVLDYGVTDRGLDIYVKITYIKDGETVREMGIEKTFNSNARIPNVKAIAELVYNDLKRLKGRSSEPKDTERRTQSAFDDHPEWGRLTKQRFNMPQ